MKRRIITCETQCVNCTLRFSSSTLIELVNFCMSYSGQGHGHRFITYKRLSDGKYIGTFYFPTLPYGDF